MTEPSALLTEAEAAAQLHVCTRTMRRLRQAGAIRYVAVTLRTILYRPEDIAAFIEQRAQVDHGPSPRANGKAIRRGRRQAQGEVISFTARRRERLAAARG